MRLHAPLLALTLSIAVAPVVLAEETKFVEAPVDAAYTNPWPADLEAAYQERAGHALKFWSTQKVGGGTYGENEKQYYPAAMWAYLAGNKAVAMKAFVEADHQKQDHDYTNGVDFFWCFTIKGQVRKYFYFGKQLRVIDDAYLAQMKDGAAKWLADGDPATTPHPVWGTGKGSTVENWQPEAKGHRVDRRNTDNLRAMRNVAVYLFAEEVGNEQVRAIYKQKLSDYAATLFHIGMSEWDSPNYHSHTISAYHNLYDFAQDPQVKLTAKATLDWLYAAGAVKYFHGGFAAPNARDYGGTVAFSTNAVDAMWLYCGGTPQNNPGPDRDEVHHVTSSYRPPLAVVKLALKQFDKPVELFASKPPYRDWSPKSAPQTEFFETTFIGNTFQMGSCTSEGTGGPWNVNAFKVVIENSARGVDYLAVNTKNVLGQSFKHAGDQVAQHRDLAVWLRPRSQAERLVFQVPQTAKQTESDGVLFFQFEKTWVAIRPIGMKPATDVDRTSIDRTKPDQKSPYEAERFLALEPTGESYNGFAIEIGEGGSFDAFVEAVKSKGKLDLSKLASGEATLSGRDGATSVGISHNASNQLPQVFRNSAAHDWSRHVAVYQGVDGAPSPITQDRMGGTLTVRAGGKTFTGTYSADGRYTFRNE